MSRSKKIQRAVARARKQALRAAGFKRPSRIRRIRERIGGADGHRALTSFAGVALGGVIATLIPSALRAAGDRLAPVDERGANRAADAFWTKLPHEGTSPRRAATRSRPRTRNQHGR